MRIFMGLMIAFLIVGLAYRISTYDKNYGSLDGFVYLEQEGEKVIPMQELTVFLILGKIDGEYKLLEMEYQARIAPLEQKVKSLENEYSRAQGVVEQSVLDQSRNGDPRNPRMIRMRTMRDSLYAEFKLAREEYTSLQRSYNARMAQLVNKYSSMETDTNQKGYFNFPKVKKRKYYIFAERSSFIDRYTWFVPFDIASKGQRLNLSRTNLSFIFK